MQLKLTKEAIEGILEAFISVSQENNLDNYCVNDLEIILDFVPQSNLKEEKENCTSKERFVSNSNDPVKNDDSDSSATLEEELLVDALNISKILISTHKDISSIKLLNAFICDVEEMKRLLDQYERIMINSLFNNMITNSDPSIKNTCCKDETVNLDTPHVRQDTVLSPLLGNLSKEAFSELNLATAQLTKSVNVLPHILNKEMKQIIVKQSSPEIYFVVNKMVTSLIELSDEFKSFLLQYFQKSDHCDKSNVDFISNNLDKLQQKAATRSNETIFTKSRNIFQFLEIIENFSPALDEIIESKDIRKNTQNEMKTVVIENLSKKSLYLNESANNSGKSPLLRDHVKVNKRASKSTVLGIRTNHSDKCDLTNVSLTNSSVTNESAEFINSREVGKQFISSCNIPSPEKPKDALRKVEGIKTRSLSNMNVSDNQRQLLRMQNMANNVESHDENMSENIFESFKHSEKQENILSNFNFHNSENKLLVNDNKDLKTKNKCTLSRRQSDSQLQINPRRSSFQLRRTKTETSKKDGPLDEMKEALKRYKEYLSKGMAYSFLQRTSFMRSSIDSRVSDDSNNSVDIAERLTVSTPSNLLEQSKPSSEFNSSFNSAEVKKIHSVDDFVKSQNEEEKQILSEDNDLKRSNEGVQSSDGVLTILNEMLQESNSLFQESTESVAVIKNETYQTSEEPMVMHQYQITTTDSSKVSENKSITQNSKMYEKFLVSLNTEEIKEVNKKRQQRISQKLQTSDITVSSMPQASNEISNNSTDDNKTQNPDECSESTRSIIPSSVFSSSSKTKTKSEDSSTGVGIINQSYEQYVVKQNDEEEESCQRQNDQKASLLSGINGHSSKAAKDESYETSEQPVVCQQHQNAASGLIFDCESITQNSEMYEKFIVALNTEETKVYNKKSQESTGHGKVLSNAGTNLKHDQNISDKKHHSERSAHSREKPEAIPDIKPSPNQNEKSSKKEHQKNEGLKNTKDKSQEQKVIDMPQSTKLITTKIKNLDEPKVSKSGNLQKSTLISNKSSLLNSGKRIPQSDKEMKEKRKISIDLSKKNAVNTSEAFIHKETKVHVLSGRPKQKVSSSKTSQNEKTSDCPTLRCNSPSSGPKSNEEKPKKISSDETSANKPATGDNIQILDRKSNEKSPNGEKVPNLRTSSGEEKIIVKKGEDRSASEASCGLNLALERKSREDLIKNLIDSLNALGMELVRAGDQRSVIEMLQLNIYLGEVIPKIMILFEPKDMFENMRCLSSSAAYFRNALTVLNHSMFSRELASMLKSMIKQLLSLIQELLDLSFNCGKQQGRNKKILRHWMFIVSNEKSRGLFSDKSDTRIKRIENFCQCEINLMNKEKAEKSHIVAPYGYDIWQINYDADHSKHIGSVNMVSSLFANANWNSVQRFYKTKVQLDSGDTRLMNDTTFFRRVERIPIKPDPVACYRYFKTFSADSY